MGCDFATGKENVNDMSSGQWPVSPRMQQHLCDTNENEVIEGDSTMTSYAQDRRERKQGGTHTNTTGDSKRHKRSCDMTKHDKKGEDSEDPTLATLASSLTTDTSRAHQQTGTQAVSDVDTIAPLAAPFLFVSLAKIASDWLLCLSSIPVS